MPWPWSEISDHGTFIYEATSHWSAEGKTKHSEEGPRSATELTLRRTTPPAFRMRTKLARLDADEESDAEEDEGDDEGKRASICLSSVGGSVEVECHRQDMWDSVRHSLSVLGIVAALRTQKK